MIALIILSVIGGGAAYLLASSGAKDAKRQMTNTAGTPQTDTEPTATTSGGAYVDYHDGIIGSTAGTKLLFFHAPWCPQCRDLEADIKAKGVPAGVTIIKVDYDTSRQLRQKYGVTLQTTVVRVNDQGDLVSKFVAYGDPSLNAVVKNLL